MSEAKPAPGIKSADPFTNDELCALEDTFGRIEVTTPARLAPRAYRGETEGRTPWIAVFAVPSGPAVKRFEDAANGDSPAKKADGLRNITVDAIVALSFNGTKTIATGEDRKAVREAWRALREDHGFPGAHVAATDAVISLVGIGAEESGKG